MKKVWIVLEYNEADQGYNVEIASVWLTQEEADQAALALNKAEGRYYSTGYEVSEYEIGRDYIANPL
jgi:hypothetical protein